MNRNTFLRVALRLVLCLAVMVGGHATQARHFKDTLSFRKKVDPKHEIVMSDSTLEELGIDSLLNKVEHIHNGLNDVINTNTIGYDTHDIDDNIAEVDSNLELIEQNVSIYNNVLDVKNLQMFQVLLESLHDRLSDWRSTLFGYDHQLLAMSSELTAYRNDTLLKEIMEDTVFTTEYATEINDVKEKMKIAKLSISSSQYDLKVRQVKVSNLYFETIDLQNRIHDMLRKISLKATGKEYAFIWDAGNDSLVVRREAGIIVKKSYVGQGKILGYYFKKSRLDLLFMLACATLFFVWVHLNFRTLARAGSELPRSFVFAVRFPVAPTLALMFCIAPFFDLHPPTAYVQIMELGLVLVLSVLLRKIWTKPLYRLWLATAMFFVLFSGMGLVLVPTPGFRWTLLALNVVSVVFGLVWLRQLRQEKMAFDRMVRLVSIVFIAFNLIAVVANMYGRLSVAKILSVTGIYGLTQIIGLTVFIRVMVEAVHLQTLVNKMKGGLMGKLNFRRIEKQITTLLVAVSAVICVIVCLVSLNLYNPAFDWILDVLTRQRKIGTTEFKIGNVLLFFGILYVSYLFQMGVGSLYGREESTWDPELKKNASRLAITRLLLLVGGFMLAVAASGLPMDKITIVLGALGVGIGLGLQTIVNNLVSGVILIFEQPFRIGDYIETGDKKGRVVDIGIRSSRILMEEGAEIIMPNADLLSGRVINWTLRNDHVRIEFPLLLAAGPKLEYVREVALAVLKQAEHVIMAAAPEILLVGMTEETMVLSITVWIDDVHRTQNMQSELLEGIYKALDEKGIKLASCFPHLDIQI